MARKPVITHRSVHEFTVSPRQLWDIIQEVDQFEGWWPWLEEFRLEGDSLKTGAVLRGVVAPPVPYRMRIWVLLTGCDPGRGMQALVHGDLEGEASIAMRPQGTGTNVEVGWTVEMMQAPMRVADRVAHGLLQWGHDRVVDLTIAGFQKKLAAMRSD